MCEDGVNRKYEKFVTLKILFTENVFRVSLTILINSITVKFVTNEHIDIERIHNRQKMQRVKLLCVFGLINTKYSACKGNEELVFK